MDTTRPGTPFPGKGLLSEFPRLTCFLHGLGVAFFLVAFSWQENHFARKAPCQSTGKTLATGIEAAHFPQVVSNTYVCVCIFIYIYMYTQIKSKCLFIVNSEHIGRGFCVSLYFCPFTEVPQETLTVFVFPRGCLGLTTEDPLLGRPTRLGSCSGPPR